MRYLLVASLGLTLLLLSGGTGAAAQTDQIPPLPGGGNIEPAMPGAHPDQGDQPAGQPRPDGPPAMIRYAGFAFPAASGDDAAGGSPKEFQLALLNLLPPPPPGGPEGGVQRPVGEIVLDTGRLFIVEAKLETEGAAEGAGSGEVGVTDRPKPPKIARITGKLSKTWYERPKVSNGPGSDPTADTSLKGKPQIVGEISLTGVDKGKNLRVLFGTVAAADAKADLYLLPMPRPPKGERDGQPGQEPPEPGGDEPAGGTDAR